MITSNPLDGVRAAAPSDARCRASACASSTTTATPCAPGVVGGVEVKGPNVFAGYWRMPDKTREEFTADGWFRTGDIGEWVADGTRRVTCASSGAPRT